jgi:hypothetical protein
LKSLNKLCLLQFMVWGFLRRRKIGKTRHVYLFGIEDLQHFFSLSLNRFSKLVFGLCSQGTIMFETLCEYNFFIWVLIEALLMTKLWLFFFDTFSVIDRKPI